MTEFKVTQFLLEFYWQNSTVWRFKVIFILSDTVYTSRGGDMENSEFKREWER